MWKGTGEIQAMRRAKTKLCLKASTSCLDERKEGKKAMKEKRKHLLKNGSLGGGVT